MSSSGRGLLESGEPGNVRLCQLPFDLLQRLSRLLDCSSCWRHLAVTQLNYSQEEIDFLEYRERHGASPSEHVLQQWRQRDPLVDEVFVALSRQRFYRAMALLRPFVSTRLLVLLEHGEGSKESVLNAARQRRLQTSQSSANSGPSPTTPSAPRQETPRRRYPRREIGSDQHRVNSNIDDVFLPSDTSPTTRPPHPHASPVPRYSRSGETLLDENLHENVVKREMVTKLSGSELCALLDRRVGSGRVAAAAEPVVVSDSCNLTAGRPILAPAPHGQVAASDSETAGSADSPDLDLPLLANIPHISYSELAAAANSWSQADLLGMGGFGSVYRASWKNTAWAVKRVVFGGAGCGAVACSERGCRRAALAATLRCTLAELRLLNACRHANILPVCGYSADGPEPLLLYQLMAGGSLLDRLLLKGGRRPLTWHQRLTVALGAARALQFLHTRARRPLVHGDVKSANILLDAHAEARLGDFGLARELPPCRHTAAGYTVSRVHGTRPYLPDEYLRSRKLSTRVDTFSFGVVLYELSTGSPAYDQRRTSLPLLRDWVHAHLTSDPGRRWLLMDPRAGEGAECADEGVESAVNGQTVCGRVVFDRLLKIGERCVAQRPRDRPDMVSVLIQLETVSDSASKPQTSENHTGGNASGSGNCECITSFSVNASGGYLDVTAGLSEGNVSNFEQLIPDEADVQEVDVHQHQLEQQESLATSRLDQSTASSQPQPCNYKQLIRSSDTTSHSSSGDYNNVPRYLELVGHGSVEENVNSSELNRVTEQRDDGADAATVSSVSPLEQLQQQGEDVSESGTHLPEAGGDSSPCAPGSHLQQQGGVGVVSRDPSPYSRSVGSQLQYSSSDVIAGGSSNQLFSGRIRTDSSSPASDSSTRELGVTLSNSCTTSVCSSNLSSRSSAPGATHLPDIAQLINGVASIHSAEDLSLQQPEELNVALMASEHPEVPIIPLLSALGVASSSISSSEP